MTAIQTKCHALINAGVNLGLQQTPAGGNINNIMEADAINGGKFRKFQFGAVYWKPNLPACYISGPIYEEWSRLGFERNADLGYPITDEMPSPYSATRRFQAFENGWIAYHVVPDVHPYVSFQTVTQSHTNPSQGHFPRLFVETKLSAVLADFIRAVPLPPYVHVSILNNFARVNRIEDYQFAGAAFLRRIADVNFTLNIKTDGLGNGLLDGSLKIEFKLNADKRPVAKIISITFGLLRDAPVPSVLGAGFEPAARESLNAAIRDNTNREFAIDLTPEEASNFFAPNFNSANNYADVILLNSDRCRGDVLFFMIQ